MRQQSVTFTADSGTFIFAFHNAMDAVMFAADAQQELLGAPWPTALLEMDIGGSVMVKPSMFNLNKLRQNQPSQSYMHHPKLDHMVGGKVPYVICKMRDVRGKGCW